MSRANSETPRYAIIPKASFMPPASLLPGREPPPVQENQRRESAVSEQERATASFVNKREPPTARDSRASAINKRDEPPAERLTARQQERANKESQSLIGHRDIVTATVTGEAPPTAISARQQRYQQARHQARQNRYYHRFILNRCSVLVNGFIIVTGENQREPPTSYCRAQCLFVTAKSRHRYCCSDIVTVICRFCYHQREPPRKSKTVIANK
jgi:hypothetical protein